jgi:hypothetical protein
MAAPADIAVGASRGVEALAVLAGAAEVRPRRRFRARRRVVERPVQHDRDNHLARSPQGEKRHLEREEVVLAAPPLLLHRGHARLRRDPRRAAAAATSRAVPLEPHGERREPARRDGRVAAAEAEAVAPPAAGPLPLQVLRRAGGAACAVRARPSAARSLGRRGRRPRRDAEAAPDVDEAVPRRGKHERPAVVGHDVEPRRARVADVEEPHRAADAHRAVRDGYLQHLGPVASAPQEKLWRAGVTMTIVAARAAAGAHLEPRPVAAGRGAERVRDVHVAAFALAARQRDARRRGGGYKESMHRRRQCLPVRHIRCELAEVYACVCRRCARAISSSGLPARLPAHEWEWPSSAGLVARKLLDDSGLHLSERNGR